MLLINFKHFVSIINEPFIILFKFKLAQWKGRSYLRCLDADYGGDNRCCEPYRSAYPERVEEVVEAPGNNYVVVKRDEKSNYTRRDSYAA